MGALAESFGHRINICQIFDERWRENCRTFYEKRAHSELYQDLH